MGTIVLILVIVFGSVVLAQVTAVMIGILAPVGLVKVDNTVVLFNTCHLVVDVVGDLLQPHRVVAIVRLASALGNVTEDPLLIAGTNLMTSYKVAIL